MNGPPTWESALRTAWRAVTADDDSAPDLPEVTGTGDSGVLASALAVEDVAVASVATALASASRFGADRAAAGSAPPVTLDRGHLAAAMTSERWFRHGDRAAGAGFAPLSRFWKAADGW